MVKPGGRIVMATNGAENFSQLVELHRIAASRLGYTGSPNEALRFTLDDLPLVRAASRRRRSSCEKTRSCFTRRIRRCGSMRRAPSISIMNRPADGSHRAPMLREMQALIEEIIVREGVFRVSKIAGCYVADV